MTTVDLITGFLGSGKTTFIKKYVRKLMDSGENVCILENDYGAVNIDTMLLGELYEADCGVEMVSGACDKDCHQRRFKTKLIAMAMSGYSRVVIEPSGIFDVDEFFDTLRESPLDKWYKMGSVITIVDPTLTGELSEQSKYLLASQAAVAGTLLFSRCSDVSQDEIAHTLGEIKAALRHIHSDRDPESYYIAKPWDSLTDDDFALIAQSGCKEPCFVKLQNEAAGYSSIYFMNLYPTPGQLRKTAQLLLADSECGRIFRVKGFTRAGGEWFELNAAQKKAELKPIASGQAVIIVIGENLNKDKISEYFKLYRTGEALS